MAKKRPLYKHQRVGFRYMNGVEHAALFMRMRLGKTLLTVRKVATWAPRSSELGRRVLVVAPNSALGGWRKELQLEGNKFIQLVGSGVKRRALLEETFYEPGECWYTVNKEVWQTIPDIDDYPWDVVILDESHFIKNARSTVTKFFTKRFRRVPHRCILTGTPNPESDDELVCQMIFLHGSFLRCRDYWQFRAKYMQPDPFTGYGWHMPAGVTKLVTKELGRTALIMSLKDAGLNVKRVDVVRNISMPPKVAKLYKQAEEKFALTIKGEKRTTRWATTRHIWMRRVCNGILEDGTVLHDGKVKEILYLLEGELKGEPLVVWFQYDIEIDFVAKALKKKKITHTTLRGSVKKDEREKRRRQFQAGTFQVILAQQKVASQGYDLSTSNTMVYFSSPESAVDREQTMERTLNVDKVKAGISLLTIDLLVENTVDEDIYKAHSAKERLSGFTKKKALEEFIRRRQDG